MSSPGPSLAFESCEGRFGAVDELGAETRAGEPSDGVPESVFPTNTESGIRACVQSLKYSDGTRFSSS
jgi:hypothetical protein